MGYEIKYEGASRFELDRLARKDLREYLSKKQYAILLEMAFAAETAQHVAQLNMAVGFCGVTGRPFHAFARRYCLEAYIAWRTSGEDGVACDEFGFVEDEGDA